MNAHACLGRSRSGRSRWSCRQPPTSTRQARVQRDLGYRKGRVATAIATIATAIASNTPTCRTIATAIVHTSPRLPTRTRVRSHLRPRAPRSCIQGSTQATARATNVKWSCGRGHKGNALTKMVRASQRTRVVSIASAVNRGTAARTGSRTDTGALYLALPPGGLHELSTAWPARGQQTSTAICERVRPT